MELNLKQTCLVLLLRWPESVKFEKIGKFKCSATDLTSDLSKLKIPFLVPPDIALSGEIPQTFEIESRQTGIYDPIFAQCGGHTGRN